jgi:hypothetical protein
MGVEAAVSNDPFGRSIDSATTMHAVLFANGWQPSVGLGSVACPLHRRQGVWAMNFSPHYETSSNLSMFCLASLLNMGIKYIFVDPQRHASE